jgi:hypothetical protein
LRPCREAIKRNAAPEARAGDHVGIKDNFHF